MPDSRNTVVNLPGAPGRKAAGRQNRTRERIVLESARLFVARGFAGVSVDEIVAAAGVARSSFYRFFANREEVLAGIIRPVFESGAAAMQALAGEPPHRAVDGVLDMYLSLWAERRDALRLATRLGGTHFRLFEDLHSSYRALLTALMRRVEAEGLLRNDSGDQSARVIARIAVPVLEVYEGDPRLEALFRATMSGMLLRPGAD